jgi:hypothetical protein
VAIISLQKKQNLEKSTITLLSKTEKEKQRRKLTLMS